MPHLIVGPLYRFNYRIWRPVMRVLAGLWISCYAPPVMPAVLNMRREAGVKKRDHPYQGVALLRWLERLKPGNILELGAGQSTPFIAAYLGRNPEAQFMSIEGVQSWQRRSNDAAWKVFSRCQPVQLAEVKRIGDWAARYEVDIDSAVDFIYVDGPTIRPSSKTHMPAGKGVKLDVARALEQGCRPRAIMVEGGTDTVDYLLSMPEIKEYRFYPEFIWAHQHRDWWQCLRFRRHSLFLR